MQRIMIVFNKYWEFEPGFACILSDEARPKALKSWWPSELHDYPRPRRNPVAPGVPAPSLPRAKFAFDWGIVEFWCISDLLEHLPADGKWQSSSECKARRLAEMSTGVPPSLVIAVGTASAGDFQSLNGSVVMGTKCFLHNSRPNGTNPDSNWQAGPFDVLLDSEITREQFTALLGGDDVNQRNAANRLLSPPLNAAPELRIYAEFDAVALGNINVSDYRDYEATDLETLAAFRRTCPFGMLGSLETTHGLIRAIGSSRFVFLSGIVDRLGRFREDVAPKPYAQNFTGAHNAGIALAWLLPQLEHAL